MVSSLLGFHNLILIFGKTVLLLNYCVESIIIMNTPPRHVQMKKDLGVDCPGGCGGWIIGFVKVSNPDATTPSFLRCSNDDCPLKIILAKYDSYCAACNEKMRLKEMIVQAYEGAPYVHAACYSFAADYFASCQRCKKLISSKEDYTETTCMGKPGFCHALCVKKRSAVSSSSSSFGSCTETVVAPPVFSLEDENSQDSLSSEVSCGSSSSAASTASLFDVMMAASKTAESHSPATASSSKKARK